MLEKQINEIVSANSRFSGIHKKDVEKCAKEINKLFENTSLSLIEFVLDNYWTDKCAAKNKREILKTFILEHTSNFNLIKALDMLKSAKIPEIFETSRDSNPEQLIKYIAQQGQGILSNGQKLEGSQIEAYKNTCAIFGAELVDICILCNI
jgi:chemotaxis methyl-accepting protein methylase